MSHTGARAVTKGSAALNRAQGLLLCRRCRLGTFRYGGVRGRRCSSIETAGRRICSCVAFALLVSLFSASYLPLLVCHSLSIFIMAMMVAIAVAIACFRTRPILETWLATGAGRRADRSRWSPRFWKRRVAATLLLLPRLPIIYFCCRAIAMELRPRPPFVSNRQ